MYFYKRIYFDKPCDCKAVRYSLDVYLRMTIALVWRDRKVSEAWSKLLYFNKRALVSTERAIDTSSSDDNRNVFMHRFGSATGLSGFTCPDRTAATPFYHWQLRVPFLHRRWVFDNLFIVINKLYNKNVLWSLLILRIILKSILKRQDERAWCGFFWLRLGPGGGFLLTP